jgi:enoyl-CoA hydratase/carnithine racemase
MPHPHLAVEASPAGYRRVRLDRPERRNALDVSLPRAVTDALVSDLVYDCCETIITRPGPVIAVLAGS